MSREKAPEGAIDDKIILFLDADEEAQVVNISFPRDDRRLSLNKMEAVFLVDAFGFVGITMMNGRM